MRILLIEDHLQLVQTLTQSLGVLGIQVEACGDGLLADAALQQHAFDVVILDLALPRLTGIEILQRLRKRGDNVPVLVLTASGDTHDRVQGLNAGADDYLPKPFDLSELEARLRALHRRSLGAVHSVLRVGGLEFDTVSRRFAIGARPSRPAAARARSAGGADRPVEPSGQQEPAGRPAALQRRGAEPRCAGGLRAPPASQARRQRRRDPHAARLGLRARGRPMTRLRSLLLAGCCCPRCVLWALGFGFGYLRSLAQAHEAYDRTLLGSALVISERLHLADGEVVADLPYAALEMLRTDAQDRIFYRVADLRDGRYITGYEDLPTPLSPPGRQGLSSTTRSTRTRTSVSWRSSTRCSTTTVQRQLLVQVAETLDARRQLTRRIVAEAAAVQLLLIASRCGPDRAGSAPGPGPAEAVARRGAQARRRTT